MITIYITATNTDVGKTYTTLKLIETLSRLGKRVGVMKPIETGVYKRAADAHLLLEVTKKYNSNFLDMDITDICPIQYKLPAAPFVAKEKNRIDFERLKVAASRLKKSCDILLIESAGGLMTPVEDDFLMIDFAQFFEAKIVLITDDQLGCINNTLLNINLLEERNLNYLWCINKKSNDKSFEEVSLPYFENKFDYVRTVQDNIEEIAKELVGL